MLVASELFPLQVRANGHGERRIGIAIEGSAA